LIGNDEYCIQGHFYDATVSKMATNKIDKLLMVSYSNENWYLGVFWSEELVGNDEICIHGHFYEATIFKMVANKIVKLSMVSDFNENWYLGVFWSEELVGALNSDMGVVWELLCLHPNTIKPSYYYYYYYYYYSSASSPNELVRPNSQRLMIQSLLNFTGR
jgi:hypothetical protein